VLDGEVGALVHSFEHVAMLFRELEDRIESIHHMLIGEYPVADSTSF
jgi:hypothetical protein